MTKYEKTIERLKKQLEEAENKRIEATKADAETVD